MSSWAYNGSWNKLSGDVGVVGGARKINWTSDAYIEGVVYKSGTRSYLLEGGYNGTTPKTTLSNDFVWIAFCSNTVYGADDIAVPEFTLIGVFMIIVIIGSLLYRVEHVK